MQQQPPNSTDDKALSGLKVLLAEDSPDNQMIVSLMLSSAGVDVDVVENGQEALERLSQQHSYDVVLMDVTMPVMDGFEAVSQLRREGSRIPVIALTAHVLDDERQKCLESGFTDHISKPIDRSALLERLSNFMLS